MYLLLRLILRLGIVRKIPKEAPLGNSKYAYQRKLSILIS